MGVRREWAYRRQESERLRNDLIRIGARVPTRDSLIMYPDPGECGNWNKYRKRVIGAVSQIRFENNLMLVRRGRQYMYQLATDSVGAMGRDLTEREQYHLEHNPNYVSDGAISDETEEE
ncbi:hypothetical protein POM88_026441 [Heracleum sosnowskyi]|uniref:Uncharacterized protein n=1 Tax=Heracleum sosnowskyi TaxID=360622 RepID=A0AAD8MNX0_9APIA|nr:hypothetical protein POM88_026441 [Heracleum sosnowskyi]